MDIYLFKERKHVDMKRYLDFTKLPVATLSSCH